MIHEVNTRAFHVAEGILHTRRYGNFSERKLEHCVLSEKSLFWALTIEGENIHFMQAHILPSLGFQVARFGWREHVDADEQLDYYIDIVNLQECAGSRWFYRDLYLDILVFEGMKAEVCDTDEYLAAIDAGFFEQDEASHALTKTHELMNELAKHGYSLETYLEAQEIKLEWV